MVLQSLREPTRAGKSYEVGGPEILTYEQMVRQILGALGRSRALIHVPVPLMKPVVKLMETVLPKPPATTGLLELLNVDNTAQPDSVERYFGFRPRRFAETITYMKSYTFGRAFSEGVLGRD